MSDAALYYGFKLPGFKKQILTCSIDSRQYRYIKTTAARYHYY